MPESRHFNPVNWVRYQGWKPVVVVLLLALGLANLYPFVWMMGTSLKSLPEATRERPRPIPRQKFGLTQNGLKFEIAQFNQRQLRLLTDLVAERSRQTADTPPRRLQPLEYSAQYLATPEQAATELDSLAQLGLLERHQPTPTVIYYTLEPGASQPLHTGFNARQLLLLRFLQDESAAVRAASDVFVAPRVTRPEYAQSYNVAPDLAEEEIRQLQAAGLIDPVALQWRNYEVVLRDPETRFDLRVVTSLVIAGSVVVLTVLFSAMVGYALARMRFPGKMLVLALLLVGAVAPRDAVLIPVFRMLQSLGLMENLVGVVLWLTGASIGNALLMAGFFLSLPKEVEEAARVDGAGTFRTFFDIALPMAQPIVMTVALFSFLGAWNNFLIPLVATQSRLDMQPLSVAVFTFQAGNGGKWELINAAAAIMIVPLIVLFLLLQKHIVKSIAVGAVKG